MKSSKATIRFNAKAVKTKVEQLKQLADVKFGPRAGRRDFYDYLDEVYRFVLAWKGTNRNNRLRDHIAELQGLDEPRSNADAFLMVIEATCPRQRKTNSKFAIALWNAEQAGISPQEIASFLEEIGGPTTISTRASKKKIAERILEAKKLRSGSGRMATAIRKAKAKSAVKRNGGIQKRKASSEVSDDDDWD